MSDLQSYHNLADLFAQLGLPNDEVNIDNFFQHHYLSEERYIWEAPWWNFAQAAFIYEALQDNANWQVSVDELNTRLRKKIMTQPISESDKAIDINKRTAVIYAIPEISEYIVEIRHQQQNYFLGEGSNHTRYGNLEDARQAARAHNVEQCYLALSKTYQEVEAEASVSTPSSYESQRYDYLPVSLES